MKKLIVMYEENKADPVMTWSGVSYPIREGLKQYFEVIFVDSYDVLILKVLKRIAKKIEQYKRSIVLKPLYEKLHELELEQRISKYKDVPVLEIGESTMLKREFYIVGDISFSAYDYISEKQNAYKKYLYFKKSNGALKDRIKREQELDKKAKAVFYFNQWVVEYMKKRYPENKDKYIFSCCEINKELLKPDNSIVRKDNQILFVGFDFLRKGGDLVVEAFKVLKDKYMPNAKLLIIGPNKIPCDVCDDIEILGKKTYKELSRYYQESTIFCMPSRVEAGGSVFNEALSYGLPIVARDDYEMSYIVIEGKNGYLIDDEDVDNLALKMYQCMTNMQIRDYTSKHALDYYRKGKDEIKIIANVINKNY